MPLDLLVRHMVGRELSEEVAESHHAAQSVVILRVEGLARGRDFRDIGFEVRRGEIVALAGLVGAGRTAKRDLHNPGERGDHHGGPD